MTTYGFQTQLDARKIKEPGDAGRARWKLDEPLEYYSETFGPISVPAGFETDFASVPRLPLAYWLTGDTAHASAVVHDYLCRHWYTACRITWAEAAKVFREAMAHEGVPLWRRNLMYFAVRLAGRNRPAECDD
jgi:hypothetical protein